MRLVSGPWCLFSWPELPLLMSIQFQGHFYRETFQEHAGWAQTVLFAAHLKQSKWIAGLLTNCHFPYPALEPRICHIAGIAFNWFILLTKGAVDTFSPTSYLPLTCLGVLIIDPTKNDQLIQWVSLFSLLFMDLLLFKELVKYIIIFQKRSSLIIHFERLRKHWKVI